MERFHFLFLVCLVMVFTGCNTMINRIAPETVQEAKTNFDYLRRGQYERIESTLDPGINRTNLRANLQTMAAIVPRQDAVSVKTVGAYATCDTRTGCDTRVTLEYEFPSKWLLLQMVVHKQGSNSFISSLVIQPESESLEAVNRFTLRGKDSLEYLILAAAIASTAFMIYVLVLCIKTPIPKRKWMWIVLVLLGIGKVGINWTTGEAFYRVFWISILPAGLGSELYGPWMVYVSLPLGALVFLIYRERLRRRIPPAPLEAMPTSGAGGEHLS